MLSAFLITEIFSFLLIFCRLGTAMMLLPGFGEAYVAPRVRLMMALLFSLLLTPVVAALPPPPESVFGLLSLLLAEILVGLFFGTFARLLIAALHIGGSIIAYQAGLVSALVPSLSQTQAQDTSLGNFLSVAAVTLLFATDLHHLMLRGLADSYSLFPPGQFPAVADMASHLSQTVSGAFRAAMQIAAPHLVIGVLAYLAAGIIARLMPNIQIFFIMVPPQLLLSFFVLMVTASTILLWYMEYFKTSVGTFLTP